MAVDVETRIKVKDVIQDLFAMDADDKHTLQELGMDNDEVNDLVEELNDTFTIRMDVADIHDRMTVGDLIEKVQDTIDAEYRVSLPGESGGDDD